MEAQEKTSVRARVMLPLTLFLAVLLAAMVYAFHLEENEHATEHSTQTFASAQHYYETSLAAESQKLAGLSMLVARDANLASALATGDRDALLRLAGPLFQELRGEHRVTHWYFLAPNRSTLLRMHEPPRHGDIITRFTAQEAERTGKTAAGVELGPLGTFTLRVVSPWRLDGKLIGYIELGEEIEPILRRINDIFTTDLFMSIDKRFLDQAQWQEGMRLLGRKGEWNRLPGSVLTFGTLSDTPPAIADALAAPRANFSANRPLNQGSHYLRAVSLPLREASGRLVGTLLMTHDVTEQFEAGERHVAVLGGSIIALGALLLMLFHLMLGRVERRLENSRLALTAAAQQREAEQARHIRELDYLAYYDGLTGLPNRTLFSDRLTQAIIDAKHAGQLAAVLLIGIDRFKAVNETLGHEAGDSLLKSFVERLRHCVHEGDTLARTGGDEFAIILAPIAHAEEAAGMARRILESFAPPFDVAGNRIFSSSSVGIALFPIDGGEIETLLKNAASALHFAKEQGRNNYQFYAPELTSRAMERFTMESALRHAVARSELLLHYQPQISSTSGRVTGVEALLRWQHPELGLVPPNKFIPLAEESNLIVAIGEWVLRSACAQAKAWHEAGLGDIRVAVNLSTRQFKQNHLSHTVAQVLENTGLDGRWLELEITESLLIDDSPALFEELFALKTLGVTISIDDFGTGYSSLSYLKRFPIDVLKIDQSFVRDATKGEADAALVRAMIAMAHSLHMKVIAEGVETEEQAGFLRGEGCEEMQGYYFARPLPAGSVMEFFTQRRQTAAA